jgi:hypothetical protein
MPYEIQEIDDFDCDETICENNDGGFCTIDENTKNLSSGRRDYCLYFRIGHNKECEVYGDSGVQDFLDSVGEDVNYVELDPESSRLVLKVMNVRTEEKAEERLTVFRVDAEDEGAYHFFVHVDGGVGAIHKSVVEADFLKKV